ncbi:SprT family zinc-dependent metalloprotease [Propionivibrio sp.]|uniref:M48 family metallopeptidase n=1 Tax=Propionivibrio sp. TaxID=2212460 RepID=UPI002632B834|nr:SprT family zinc-dependent metalloprotease [Propionivibrio sp.]
MPWQAELPLGTTKPLAADETPRTIALGDRIVPYVLRRARRRTIGLSIDHRGLRVGAPRRASLLEVESLILHHSDWVAQKLDEWRSRRRPDALKIVDGARLPMLGESLEIRLALGSNRAIWNEHAAPILTLCLRSPSDAGRLLEKTLREKARRLFAERLVHYAERLTLTVPALALSAARTRWGSCSLKTGIRLNWRLIHFPLSIVDYVVAHELAHLREMNHSPRFWSIVGQLYPEYKAARDELKHLAAHCPHW